MKVHSIKLFNFAKYDQVDVSFDDKTGVDIKVLRKLTKSGSELSFEAPEGMTLDQQWLTDLFINSTLAQLGANLIWKLFREGMITHHGAYLNLETMKVNPIAI
jgi:hypothetical protein